MSTLYSLTTAYKAVWGVVESEDTDLATIEEALTSIKDTIAVKAENIALFIKDLDDEAKIIKQEELRLSARRKAVETKRDIDGDRQLLGDYLPQGARGTGAQFHRSDPGFLVCPYGYAYRTIRLVYFRRPV